MRRRLSRLALGLFTVGSLLVTPLHAGAVALTKAAWWYRTSDPVSVIPRQAAPPTRPDVGAPPVTRPVPEGHVLVEGTPEGPTAIAALTYKLDGRESSPVLTITPQDGSRTGSDMVLLACRAAVEWSSPGAGPGRWQDKPLVDCSRSVNGILGDDGKITFALQLLISGPDLDVVLVPGVVASTPGGGRVGSTFWLTFDADAGATMRTDVTADTPPLPPTVPGVAASPEARSFMAPAFVPPVAPIAAPALEPEEQAPVVPKYARPAEARRVGKPDPGRRLGIAILAAAIVLFAASRLMTWVAHDGAAGPARLRDLRVGRGDPRRQLVGGLGRFERPRAGKPPTL